MKAIEISEPNMKTRNQSLMNFSTENIAADIFHNRVTNLIYYDAIHPCHKPFHVEGTDMMGGAGLKVPKGLPQLYVIFKVINFIFDIFALI